MLKEVSMETLQRTSHGKDGKLKLHNAWAVTIYCGDKIISHIPLCVAIESKKELLMLENDIKAYNILKDKTNDKECFKHCLDLLHYFITIDMSKFDVEGEYVRESYMGLVGKHAVESIMMHAIDMNAMKVDWIKSYGDKETPNCKLYKSKYYVTLNMVETLINNMVSKMSTWQLNNYYKQFKTDLSKKKSVKMLADYIFNEFIVLDKDINCKELVFITDCLKAYKHETVF